MSKSSAKSESLRFEGNTFYGQKKFYDALLKYNESLCFAEPNSEMMGLAFANRSVIYFEMKLYDKCLHNITLAKQNQYPAINSDILNKREDKCLVLIKPSNDDTTPDVENFVKLSYPSHKKLPFVVDCLELKYNKVHGRHILSKQSLKAGDIISIEKPFCKIIQNKSVYQICTWCFSSNLLDLIPCNMCTKAMFCSKECEITAFESFHKYECPLRDTISILTSNMQMALRTFFVALSLYKDSCNDLQSYLMEHPESCTIFDLEDFYKKQHELLAINSLITCEETYFDDNIFGKIFQVSPVLKTMWLDHGNFIANFLEKQTKIATLNYHEIYIWPLKKGRLQDDDVDMCKGSLAYHRGVIAAGNGSYPFTSLLNHHCAPNVSRVFIDDRLVYFVQRPINKGDQLFDNYGYTFTNTSKDHRQMELLKQYKFKCGCQACVNDWPILSALKINDKICLNKAKKVCRELNLTGLNRKKAVNKYKELCEIINKNQKNFPSLEICSIMQSATAYLEMILKPEVQFP